MSKGRNIDKEKTANYTCGGSLAR